MPERIQLRRVKGWRMPPNTVKVDRTTKWGNPYQIVQNTAGHFCIVDGSPVSTRKRFQPTGLRYATRQEAVEASVRMFRRAMTSDERIVVDVSGCMLDVGWALKLRDQIEDLRGHGLACWCKPGKPCHADVLLEIANGPQAEGGGS